MPIRAFLHKGAQSGEEMTVAVCLKCGAIKHGAFTPCSACRYTPDDDESLTKHLLVTDHYLSREELNAISARIKAGETITFDEESLRWVSKAAMDAEMKRMSRGCTIGCLVLAIAVAGIFAAVQWLF